VANTVPVNDYLILVSCQ